MRRQPAPARAGRGLHGPACVRAARETLCALCVRPTEYFKTAQAIQTPPSEGASEDQVSVDWVYA